MTRTIPTALVPILTAILLAGLVAIPALAVDPRDRISQMSLQDIDWKAELRHADAFVIANESGSPALGKPTPTVLQKAKAQLEDWKITDCTPDQYVKELDRRILGQGYIPWNSNRSHYLSELSRVFGLTSHTRIRDFNDLCYRMLAAIPPLMQGAHVAPEDIGAPSYAQRIIPATYADVQITGTCQGNLAFARRCVADYIERTGKKPTTFVDLIRSNLIAENPTSASGPMPTAGPLALDRAVDACLVLFCCPETKHAFKYDPVTNQVSCLGATDS
jgi:hypothetical protein